MIGHQRKCTVTDVGVSVVIPAFNAERWLKATVESVLSQDYENLELIVVNDGSTDSTQEVAERISDPRSRCIQQTNRGLSAARNTGIRAASGSYVALLDADDLFRSTKLSEQVEALEKRPDLGVVTCGFELIDEDGKVFGKQRHWIEHPDLGLSKLLFWNPLLPSTLLIRRECFERVGLFDETLDRYEDWEFAIRLGLAGYRIDYVRRVLLSYRRHRTNISSSADLVKVATNNAERFMDRVFGRKDLSREIKSLKPKVFGNLHLDAAARAYASGLPALGRHSLEKALHFDPVLLEGDPPKWVTAICGHALGTLVRHPSSYLGLVADNLPPGKSFQPWTKHRMEAQMEAAKAFRFKSEGSLFRARWTAFRALVSDLRLLRNRGLWSIALKP